MAAQAAPIGYAITVTTAYAAGDPFPNRLDQAFTEPDTGFFEVTNTGATSFVGLLSTVAVSAFAGDLSFASGTISLPPGASASVAIPDDAKSVGGFNGPAYYYRPGVEISLSGTISSATASEAVGLQVADANIQSGIWRTDPFGLATDSFVLQGGDPWGFDNTNSFALSQPYGVYVFSQAVPEPASAALLASAALGLLIRRVASLRPPVA